METKSFLFKIRGLVQSVELPEIAEFWHQKKIREEAKKVFKQRGFIDLKLNEVQIYKNL